MEKVKVKGKNLSVKNGATGKTKTKETPKEVTKKEATKDIPVTIITKRKITQKILPVTEPAAGVPVGVINYNENKRKRRHGKLVFFWVFVIFATLFLAFGFTAPYIFRDTNHWTYEYFVTNTVNIRNVGQFFRDKLPVIFQSIMIVIVFGIVINLVVYSIMKMSIKNKRTKTVAGMVGSFTRYIGYFFMIISVLRVWGVNTAAILSGAAIFSAVIAFGAQSLVSDILAGIFMVFENNFAVGDIITIEGIGDNNFRGYVENIGIRTTQIRAELGEVMIIANSQMKKIVNQSIHRCGIICAVTVDHGENTDKIEKIVGSNIMSIAEKIPEITEEPTYLGVSEITQNGIVLKFFAKCDESMRYRVTRRLTQEIKILFNRHNIKFAMGKIEVHKEGK
jgi:small conductance mechanosensitive channel